MPTAEQILSGLAEIANQWWWLALAWHLCLVLLLVAFFSGWRPTARTVGVLLALPLFSVSALAWVHGNPFNGGLFALAGVISILFVSRLDQERVQPVSGWAGISGVLLIVFGWVYPHFLDSSPWFTYLYAAPTGLVPCPTLSVVIGLGLLLGGLGSRGWTLLMVVMGLFYALFGALRLGVNLDWVLLAGALLLVVYMLTHRPKAPLQG
jgi:hypothetical protein